MNNIRPAAALAGAGTMATVAGWAAPASALHRARVLRSTVCPILAGIGRPGSVALQTMISR
ncbi:MAG: hypothetical protein ABIZ05_11685 [Pseudonocardiaceae bacterium]